MTVTTSVNKIIATGDAVQVDFPHSFIVLEESHMNVYLDGVLEDTANWSWVSAVDPQDGGTVTMAVAPGVGVKVTLLRTVPNTQLTDYSAYGSFPAETHERALDLRVMEAQQIQEGMDRALKAPIDDAGAFDYSLPSPTAGKGWKINATNDGIILTTNDPDEQESLAAAQVVLATAQAGAASGSATAAQLRAWEAEAEKMTADSYATEAEDVFVNSWASDGDGTFTATPTVEYSALHWKAKAAAEATASAASAAILEELNENPATTTGLTWGWLAGQVRSDNVTTDVAAGTILLTDNATNYVEYTVSGGMTSNTTGFTSGAIPIRTVVTLAGSQTSSADERAWLIGDYYNKGNILGTVSQTAGVPTGAIIERGSNANGEYAKYADGTMIALTAITSSLVTTTATGALYTATATVATLPVTFVGDYLVSPAIYPLVGRPFSEFAKENTSSTVLYRILGTTNTSEAQLRFTAIGKWF